MNTDKTDAHCYLNKSICQIQIISNMSHKTDGIPVVIGLIIFAKINQC